VISGFAIAISHPHPDSLSSQQICSECWLVVPLQLSFPTGSDLQLGHWV